jgi:hypothetical protein
MVVVNKIKQFVKDIRIGILSSDYKWTYMFLRLEFNDKLKNHMNKIAHQLAESENIQIFYVSSKEMNKKEILEKDWAAGLFIYKNSENSQIIYEKLKMNLYLNDKELAEKIFKQREFILPRIEISSDDGDVWTLIHELGHYFMYKRNEEQSEEKADLYAIEFFDNHLPPFFKWVFQIMYGIRIKQKTTFTKKESYLYYQDYKKWITSN